MTDNTTQKFAIEPATAAFIAEQDAERATGPAEPSLVQLRQGYADHLRRRSVAPSPYVSTRDLVLGGPAGPLQARLYTPQAVGQDRSALLLYIHGGGFAVGDLDTHDALVRHIAETAGLRALTIAYRRAPENKYPAAREDVLAAYSWARANASELNIDPSRIVLGGESAGGTHSVAALLALRDQHHELPLALWAFVPALDAAGTGDSHREFAEGAGRPDAEFKFLWSLYRPENVDPADPGLSPLYADPSGLPLIRIYTAEFDPARSDGESFVVRAKEQGVDAQYRREAGLIHQFPEIIGISPDSHAAVTRAARDLAEIISSS